MFDNLNIDSVVKCLEIAFQLEVPEFKEKIFKFTTDNNEVIMKSTQMKELIKNNDIVSSALFLYMANQLKKRDEQLQKIESDNSNVSLKTGSLVQELDHDNRSEISQTVSSYQHRLDSLQAELQEALNGDIMVSLIYLSKMLKTIIIAKSRTFRLSFTYFLTRWIRTSW